MPGTLIDAVLADGAIKGIVEGEILEIFLEAMVIYLGNSIKKASIIH